MTAILQYHLKKENSFLVKQVLKNLYVDNILESARDYYEVKEKYKELQTMLLKPSMNVEQFLSIDSKFKANLSADDKDKKMQWKF